MGKYKNLVTWLIKRTPASKMEISIEAAISIIIRRELKFLVISSLIWLFSISVLPMTIGAIIVKRLVMLIGIGKSKFSMGIISRKGIYKPQVEAAKRKRRALLR